MGSQVLPGKRRQSFLLPPEDLVLITDKDHPLYDERVELPPDEKIVRNMMKYGVRVALKVRKDGESIEVVDGRRRTINAREANRRLVEEGRDPLLVACEVSRGTDQDHADEMTMLNELRRGDDPITKARKIQRYLDSGRTVEEASMVWGVGEASIKNYLKMLDCAPAVQEAVAAGRLGFTAAQPLAKLPRAEQNAAVADLPPAAKNGKPKRKDTGKKKGKRKVLPSPKLIRSVAEHGVTPAVKEALLWVLGDIKHEDTGGKLFDAITFASET